MQCNEIRFTDGAAYERFMGKWSKLAGGQFLDWVSPASGLDWLDVGCGNGAFTAMLIDRCGTKSVRGIDRSEEQLAYARSQFTSPAIQFQRGDAMALPFQANSFDAAVMPLVIFFVPDPAKGVSEMKRVLRPNALACAYAWDMLDGGFPYNAMWEEMRGLGVNVPLPPNPEASRIVELRKLWMDAGFSEVETREIAVQRTFDNFDDYWGAVIGGPSVSCGLASMPAKDLEVVQMKLREHLPVDVDGRIVVSARANAVKGFS